MMLDSPTDAELLVCSGDIGKLPPGVKPFGIELEWVQPESGPGYMDAVDNSQSVE